MHTEAQDLQTSGRHVGPLVVVFAILILTHCYFTNRYPGFLNPNTASRVYLTLAIVDHGTLSIDQCLTDYGSTQDKALFEGHYFTDKAPGASLLLVPAAWLLRHTVMGDAGIQTMVVGLRLLGLTLPALLFWFLTRRTWFKAAGSEKRGLALILAGALGTNFFVYSTHLFGHVQAGILLFWAYLAIERLRRGSGRSAAFLAGLLLGLAFVTDYVVVIAVAVVGVYGLVSMRADRSRAGLIVAGAALPLALLFWYNDHCFGGPLRLGFHYSVDPVWRRGYESGLAGIQAPDLGSLWGMWFSAHRGMAYLSPFLILAPVGYAMLWWNNGGAPPRQRRGERADAVVAALTAAGLALFASTTLDWQGGWGVGVRYLVPAVPFLLLGVGYSLRDGRRGRLVTILFGGLTIPAFVLVGSAAATFPYFPENFANPLHQYAMPFALHSLLAESVLSAAGFDAGLWPYALLTGGASLTFLYLLVPQERRSWLRHLVAPLVVAAVCLLLQAVASPPLSETDRTMRARVLHFLGYDDEARAELERRR